MESTHLEQSPPNAMGAKTPRRRAGAGFKLAFLMLSGGVAPAFAQGTDAVLSGAVRDPSGAVVPGASVMAGNLKTGAVAKTSPVRIREVKVWRPASRARRTGRRFTRLARRPSDRFAKREGQARRQPLSRPGLAPWTLQRTSRRPRVSPRTRAFRDSG